MLNRCLENTHGGVTTSNCGIETLLLDPMRSITLGLLLMLCSAWRGWGQEAQVQLVFLDVGQGDAIVVRSPEGKTALIDSGNNSGIVYHLHALGIDTIDIGITSHPHANHIGGMAAVLRNFPVRYYMDNGVPHTTATGDRDLLRTVSNSNINYLETTACTIELGSVPIHVFPPMERATNLNNQSIGLLIQHGEFEAWLSGDSEIEELNHFLSLGVPSVDVLKAAHHGSRDAVSPGWLSATHRRRPTFGRCTLKPVPATAPRGPGTASADRG